MRRSPTRTDPRRSTLAMLVLLPALAWAEAPAPSAPAVVKVGDLDGTFIRPVSIQWKISQTTPKGDTLDWGTSTYEVQLLEMEGRQVLKRTQVITTKKGTTTDVAVADRRTFAPLRSEESSASSQVRYDFTGDRVKVERSGDVHGDARSAEVKLDMPVFDFNLGMYELQLAALPLAEGYAARLPTLQYPQKVEWSTVKVTGREKVDAGGGRQMEAWVVEVLIPGFREVVWLAKEPPYILKEVFYGPRGGRETFAPR